MWRNGRAMQAFWRTIHSVPWVCVPARPAVSQMLSSARAPHRLSHPHPICSTNQSSVLLLIQPHASSPSLSFLTSLLWYPLLLRHILLMTSLLLNWKNRSKQKIFPCTSITASINWPVSVPLSSAFLPSYPNSSRLSRLLRILDCGLPWWYSG